MQNVLWLPQENMTKKFPAFACWDLDVFTVLPSSSKLPPKKMVKSMTLLIEQYGLMRSLVTDEKAMVLAGAQHIKKAKTSGVTSLASFQILNLSEAEKYAFAHAYKLLNNSKE